MFLIIPCSLVRSPVWIRERVDVFVNIKWWMAVAVWICERRCLIRHLLVTIMIQATQSSWMLNSIVLYFCIAASASLVKSQFPSQSTRPIPVNSSFQSKFMSKVQNRIFVQFTWSSWNFLFKPLLSSVKGSYSAHESNTCYNPEYDVWPVKHVHFNSWNAEGEYNAF